MAVGRISSPASRRLALVAALPLIGTALATPAHAAHGVSASGGTSSSVHAAERAAKVQQKVASYYAAYEASRQRVEALSVQAARLSANADRAGDVASELRERVSDEDAGLFNTIGGMVSPGDSELDRAAEAAADAEAARQLSDMVQQKLADSIAQAEHDRHKWEAAQRRQERIEATWSARQVIEAAIRRSQFPAAYAVTDPAQDRRNHLALRAWERYLRQVGTAAVVPPPAKQLADPSVLPSPLEPVRDAGYRSIPGVGEARLPDGRAVTVLPAETVRTIAEAFHRVGLTTVPGDVDSTTYACGGLVANSWGTSMVTLPSDVTGQFEKLHPVPRATLQLGDVIVLGGKRAGLDETAVYVGQQRVIVADPGTGTAGVQPLPARFLGVRRATLPGVDKDTEAPAGGVCAPAAPTPVVDGSGPLQIPLDAGSYRLSAGFGDGGHLWSSGEHTGQDLAAPTGTPVHAAATGVVTVEHPSWAGNLVRIDHGGGVETWYAHLSRVDVSPGQTVGPGQQIGAVGNLGNTTGPHLHFEVRLDGSPVDPTQVLDLPEAPRPTYTNGEVPETALCTATSDGAQLLRCDAAVAFRLMGAAFESANGAPMCITDSYRSRDGQERVHVLKPNMTATPGTSVHGWGLAVDLCGGIESFDTSEHAWMIAHGPAYGWHHPAWAEAGGSRPEPWHFEYNG